MSFILVFAMVMIQTIGMTVSVKFTNPIERIEKVFTAALSSR